MVLVDVRHRPLISFTQINQYLRCPLKYRLTYIDRLEPEFVPATLAFGSGIHGAAALFYRGLAQGQRPSVEDVQEYFRTFWRLGDPAPARPLRRQGHAREPARPRREAARGRVRAGPVGDRDLVGSVDLLERDAEGLVVVDLKTAARKYTDLQVEASPQLSVYSYATTMAGFADQEDLRLRFDVLTKTKEPELHRYSTTRDLGANRRLFRLASEVIHAVETGVFPPNPRWQCKECQYRSQCWAWR
jgi:putative RecB family exonuclease